MICALQRHIGRICHIYLDDSVIWSRSLEEHAKNVKTILQTLKDAHLYCNSKKMSTPKLTFWATTYHLQESRYHLPKLNRLLTGWPQLRRQISDGFVDWYTTLQPSYQISQHTYGYYKNWHPRIVTAHSLLGKIATKKPSKRQRRLSSDVSV